MSLDTSIDLILHLLFTYIIGYIVYKKWNKRDVSFWGAFTGGILIDLDHFIDYFLAYGLQFNVSAFFRGYQFLKSDKLYIIFHAWEYVVILFFILWFLKKKQLVVRSFLLALMLSMFFHLVVDSMLNQNQFEAYSILYRIEANFELKKLSTPSQYRNIQMGREQLRIWKLL